MASEETLTIGQVSQLTGLSVHALRYYEREQLLITAVQRDGGGRRTYSASEVGWLEVCTKLRSSGMPLADIRRYADLVRSGPGTEIERFELLQAHQVRVQAQLTDLIGCLSVIDAKVAVYADHLDAGSAGSLWTDGPDCPSARPSGDPVANDAVLPVRA